MKLLDQLLETVTVELSDRSQRVAGGIPSSIQPKRLAALPALIRLSGDQELVEVINKLSSQD
jgi:hypothetical protein